MELQELPKSSSEHLIEETETTSLMRTEGFSCELSEKFNILRSLSFLHSEAYST